MSKIILAFSENCLSRIEYVFLTGNFITFDGTKGASNTSIILGSFFDKNSLITLNKVKNANQYNYIEWFDIGLTEEGPFINVCII